MSIKTITPIALLFAAALAQAEPLYYYVQAGKVGVKTASGRIVITPKPMFAPLVENFAEQKTPIRDHTIELCYSEQHKEDRKGALATDAGDVYSRSGQYLYSPIVYDNDCDYWQEGMRRYVENGRVGFVRRDGSRATPAQWDFATPFEHGYATVYRGGWQKEWTDDEHWTLAPATPDAVSEVINQRGEAVAGGSLKTAADDVKIGGKYYPNPFAYTPAEQRMADYFNQQPVLQALSRYYVDSPEYAAKLALKFEIVERPSAALSYYVLRGFDPDGDAHDDAFFLVSADGKQRFAVNGYDALSLGNHVKKTPLRHWVRGKLLQARDYLREHPNKPHRFDVDKYLRQWR